MNLMPDEFWNLTYAEFISLIKAQKKKITDRKNELITLAWNTAALTRCKNMPSLKSLIQKNTEKKHRQTDEEMLNMCKILNAAFGGTVVEV